MIPTPDPTSLPVLTARDADMGERVLECPRCGDTNTHVDTVRVLTASGRGVAVTTGGTPPGSWT